MTTQQEKTVTQANKPKIYAFINGGSPGWYSAVAVAEDGEVLAGHVCSHSSFGPHDMGATSEWKHESYREKYPEGFEVVWFDANDPANAELIEKIKKLNAAFQAVESEAANA